MTDKKAHTHKNNGKLSILNGNLSKLSAKIKCRAKTSCPMKGQCRESSIIYKATPTTDGIAKNYYGCSKTEFKARFYNHNQSFKFRQKSNATELSKAFWQAKDTGKNPSIEWSIAARTTPYHPGARRCNLCLAEKLFILRADLPQC